MMQEQNRIFYNYPMDKTAMRRLIGKLVGSSGNIYTASILDQLKSLGFEYATRAGISLGVDDLLASPSKQMLIKDAECHARFSEDNCNRGCIDAIEKLRQIVETWHSTSEFLKREMNPNFHVMEPLNPVHMMSFSGARGNTSQVHQLVGMRGLMSNPQGRIIDLPIQSNLREGLSITEYIISCYGARKGVVDTAIRTADAGYLTRRLVEVAQHLVIRNLDCFTFKGIYVSSIKSDQGYRYISSEDRLVGRVLARSIHINGRCVALRNEDIGYELANRLISYNNDKILIRSPLTCKSMNWACQLCYGWNSNYGKLIQLGEAIGVIAAQSIGEPGTQLTLRTFHTGGVFTGEIANYIRSPFTGIIHFEQAKCDSVRNRHGRSVWKCCQEMTITIKAPTKSFIFTLPQNSLLLISDNYYVHSKQVIAEIRAVKSALKERVQKHLYSNISGEIFYTKKVGDLNRNQNPYKDFLNPSVTIQNTGHVWILSSQFCILLQPNICTFYNNQDFIFLRSFLGKNLYISMNTNIVFSNFYTRYTSMIHLNKSVWLNFDNHEINFQTNVINEEMITSIYTGIYYSLNSISPNYPNKLHSLILSFTDLYYVYILNNIDLDKKYIEWFNNDQYISSNKIINKMINKRSYSSKTHDSLHNTIPSLNMLTIEFVKWKSNLTLKGLIGIRKKNHFVYLIHEITVFNIIKKWLKTLQRLSRWCFWCCDHLLKIDYFFNKYKWISFVYYLNVYLKAIYEYPILGEIVSQGTQLIYDIKLIQCGKIVCISNMFYVLRLAQCYLLVNGTKLHVYRNELIKLNQPLFTLIYEQLRASDIVQGLPKAEQLLEARSNNEIVLKLKTDFELWTNYLYSFFNSHILCTYKSIQTTQVNLVNHIQTVYLSQGVHISDKHVEVIVRQMTSKVLFIDKMYHIKCNAIFLPGELIELSRAKRMSIVLNTLLPYKPIILGITKASLNNESFLSAASFQRTTNVLSTSALKNKIDWIKGLQENVLFGAMIPTGTGCEQIFNQFRLRRKIIVFYRPKYQLFSNKLYIIQKIGLDYSSHLLLDNFIYFQSYLNSHKFLFYTKLQIQRIHLLTCS